MLRVRQEWIDYATYLFAEVAKRRAAFQAAHPEVNVISLGIGDIALPLLPDIKLAFDSATQEMTERPIGYGPSQGYDWLRRPLVKVMYTDHGIDWVTEEDVSIDPGAKEAAGGFVPELFTCVTDAMIITPAYPVYGDTCTLVRGMPIKWLEATAENDFRPMPPEDGEPCVIYLCYPNNPTGQHATREYLKAWVDFALKTGSIIIYDVAYADFIQDPDLPRSIYEIPGAEHCAIEMGSFSKWAGFTGLRCSWTIVPPELKFAGSTEYNLAQIWKKRLNVRTNGVPYPVQRAAQQALEPGVRRKLLEEQVGYYMNNAALIGQACEEMGWPCAGGINSPYIWAKVGGDSWEFFDSMLEKGVVCTPGSGFGDPGQGYVRYSSFGEEALVEEAVSRF
ncbi:aminotransferase class I/II-fold pyridoxal phosphate-dependent enzyme [Pseudomonadota bacterium]